MMCVGEEEDAGKTATTFVLKERCIGDGHIDCGPQQNKTIGSFVTDPAEAFFEAAEALHGNIAMRTDQVHAITVSRSQIRWSDGRQREAAGGRSWNTVQ